MAIIASLNRLSTSLKTHGSTIKVFLHPGEDRILQVTIMTDGDYLITYTLQPSETGESRYKLESIKLGTSHRRRSLGSGIGSDYVTPYFLRYKRTIKVDSGISRYVHLDLLF